jgi:membrane fusion protein (multidrug efflux system)
MNSHNEIENKPNRIRKPMFIMLVAVGVLFGGIFLYKMFVNVMMQRFFKSAENPVITVSTTKAGYSTWTAKIQAVGSTRAILGVNVTAQVGGMIQTVTFTPGSIVNKDTVLVQQNADPNLGQLHSLQAQESLDKITYDRDVNQYKAKGISKQQLDSDLQNWKSVQGQVEQQKAIVQQLTITAPFTGRLGVSNVYPGQYLKPGDSVVTLQSLDPIYVDFYLPQQDLANLKVGHEVNINADAYPNDKFDGQITTINPVVDADTRNFVGEATIPNPDYKLLPGMFVNVTVIREVTNNYITLPITAVTYNPYGELVYVVKKQTGKNNKNQLFVEQQFVTTGASRGDQVAILKGLNSGDEVVTSGQLKLKNGSLIAVNNKVAPDANPNPTLPDQHGQG